MKEKKRTKQFLSCLSIFLLVITAFSIPSSCYDSLQLSLNYIDITVQEARDYLFDTSNGIQIPIDVRSDGEWLNERIDTPFPEFPRQSEKDEIFDYEGYLQFVESYDGNEVILYCKSGGRSSSVANMLISRGFNGTVYNMLGGIDAWKTAGYPTKTGNTAPATSNQPIAPSTCNPDISYQFSIHTTDPDEDPLRYGWDWNNDKLVDEWSPYAESGDTVSISHEFNTSGIINISVLAQDNVGINSSFSETVTVTVNTPPTLPEINGPFNGKAGTAYTYTIVSVDADGDQLSYFIDWGDDTTTGWTRVLPSGEEYMTSHIWEEKNDYIVQIRAKDTNDAVTDWVTFEVSMPKTGLYCFVDFLLSMYPQIHQFIHLFLPGLPH